MTPHPKFTLQNIGRYRARPSKSTIWDMAITAFIAVCWAGALFSLYLLITGKI